MTRRVLRDVSRAPFLGVQSEGRDQGWGGEKGPAARRRPKAAREAYLLYVERACRGRQRSRWTLLAAPARLDMVWGRPYNPYTRLPRAPGPQRRASPGTTRMRSRI